MNSRNRSHIISPSAAFKLRLKVADVLGILGRLMYVFVLAAIAVLAIAIRRSHSRLDLTRPHFGRITGKPEVILKS